jgi:alpha-1,2-mannosyltransferase
MAPAVAALTGGVVALAAAWHPLEVAPFSHRLLAIVLLAHAMLLLWAALLRSPGRAWWALPETADPTAVVLLMGIAYGALLAYHFLLCQETHAFCPPAVTMIAGGAALLMLVVIAASGAAAKGRTLALALVAAGGVAAAVAAAARALHRSAVDFATLWTAARSSLLGGSLYRPEAVAANHFGAVFKVPPFYGMLLLPYGRMEVQTALDLHRALGVGLYLAGGAILIRLLRPSLGGATALAAVAIVMGFMQPSFDTLAYGQIDIVLLFLMIVALLGLRSGLPALTGLAIALAGLFKLYPLLLLVFLVVRREWKSVAWTAGWLVMLDALSVAVLGWREHVVYATQILPRIGGGTGWVENQTLNGFLCRLLAGWLRPEPVHDRTIDLLTGAGFVLVAALSAWAASRPSDRRSSLFSLQFGLFLVVMVMAVPAAWIHYETVTILAVLILAWRAADAPLGTAGAFAAAAGFGLVAYGNQWSFYDGSPRPGLTTLALSRELYGLTLLWATGVLSAIRAGGVGRPAKHEGPDQGWESPPHRPGEPLAVLELPGRGAALRSPRRE